MSAELGGHTSCYCTFLCPFGIHKCRHDILDACVRVVRLVSFCSTFHDSLLNLVKYRLVTWLLPTEMDSLLTSDFHPLLTRLSSRRLKTLRVVHLYSYHCCRRRDYGTSYSVSLLTFFALKMFNYLKADIMRSDRCVCLSVRLFAASKRKPAVMQCMHFYEIFTKGRSRPNLKLISF